MLVWFYGGASYYLVCLSVSPVYACVFAFVIRASIMRVNFAERLFESRLGVGNKVANLLPFG